MTTYAQAQAIGLTFVKAQLGKPYIMGATGPHAYDCRGLTWATYKSVGVDIGLDGSSGQWLDSIVKLKPTDPWLVLDQVFFWGADPPRPGHTGVYVGPVVPDGALMMIDAFDTAEGVRYNEFSTTGAGEGLAFVGRTRPLSLLNLKPAVPTLQMTSPYTIGLTVGVLQADLNRNGAKLTIDSIFGPKTRAAVQNFQRTHGLVVDGIVGPLTWAKLS